MIFNDFGFKILNLKKEEGFTITEMIIVISIITIFPTIVISNFSQIRGQFALTRVAYKFSQDLRETQNMALSSVPYKDSIGVSRSIAGYGIYINTGVIGEKKYIMYADNNDQQSGNQQYDILDYTAKTFDFSVYESEVFIKEIRNVSGGNSVSINFSPPDPSTVISSLSQGQNKADIVFALESDPEKIKIVSVNASGLVKVEP